MSMSWFPTASQKPKPPKKAYLNRMQRNPPTPKLDILTRIRINGGVLEHGAPDA